MKSDKSIRNLCIAAIKRRSAKPSDFLLTEIFEIEALAEIYNDTFKLSDVYENELPISQTYIDENNWTLVTTRQIISRIAGETKTTSADHVRSWNWNDFKGYEKTSFTIGELQTDTGSSMGVFIETGKASLVTIYAIMTLVKLAKSRQS